MGVKGREGNVREVLGSKGKGKEGAIIFEKRRVKQGKEGREGLGRVRKGRKVKD